MREEFSERTPGKMEGEMKWSPVLSVRELNYESLEQYPAVSLVLCTHKELEKRVLLPKVQREIHKEQEKTIYT